MLDLSGFLHRTAQAAQEIAEAVNSGAPAAPGPAGAPGRPPGAPMPPQPPPAPTGALQSAAGPSLAVKPTQVSPLEMMPAFKSPTFASMLQGEVGRQGPVGFAKGGRVQRDLAVGGPADFDFSCR